MWVSAVAVWVEEGRTGNQRRPNNNNNHVDRVNGVRTMGVILLVLIIALLLGGIGFAAHIFWIAAAVVFIAWLVGFGVARGEGSGGRARWYRW